jgi:hypothetical protein
MLERWKTPRFSAAIITLLLPVLTSAISLLSGFKQAIENLKAIGIDIPIHITIQFAPNISSAELFVVFLSGFGYLIVVPFTAMLAMRGLFLGAPSRRICFPGGQGGQGAYLEERIIFSKVDLQPSKTFIDLWLIVALWVIFGVLILLSWDYYVEAVLNFYVRIIEFLPSDVQELGKLKSQMKHEPDEQKIQLYLQMLIFPVLCAIAALRRRKSGRA